MKCEIRWCRSKKRGSINVNENIDDGCWRVLICHICAKKLGLKEGDDLPSADIVRNLYPHAEFDDESIRPGGSHIRRRVRPRVYRNAADLHRLKSAEASPLIAGGGPQKVCGTCGRRRSMRGGRFIKKKFACAECCRSVKQS